MYAQSALKTQFIWKFCKLNLVLQIINVKLLILSSATFFWSLESQITDCTLQCATRCFSLWEEIKWPITSGSRARRAQSKNYLLGSVVLRWAVRGCWAAPRSRLETIYRNEVSHLESPLRKVRRRAAGAASPTKGDDVFSKRAQPIFRKCERAGLPLWWLLELLLFTRILSGWSLAPASPKHG